MVNSIDNGELFWAIYGLVDVFDMRYPGQKKLRNQFEDALVRMAKNSVPIFYQGDGKILTVAKMTDMTKTVSENTYSNAQSECHFEKPCYIDDPYRGEMFTVMMSLFSNFPSPSDKTKVWEVKRDKLQAASFNITH